MPSSTFGLTPSNFTSLSVIAPKIKTSDKTPAIFFCGKLVTAVTNFPQKNIAGVLSEVLILGAITDKEVKLLGVNPNVEDGTKIG